MVDAVEAPHDYDAEVRRVVDGDTLVATATQQIAWPDEIVSARRDFVVRLLGVDTPERRGETREAGDAAKAYVEGLVFGDNGERIGARLSLTGRRDVYGRWIGGLRVGDLDLADALVESGHGVRRDYRAHLAALTGSA